ncbi:peptide methionine sulfoxide reductase MsrA [Gaertneriomyces semiglobifer]|nr:peptide methionine sulfoxide reductase MsrA [Gaertneriomyces semiglobifer]
MSTSNSKVATFAAGCFWGVEKAFKRKFGQQGIETRVGYAGGNASDPSYQQVCTGSTGHAEVLQVSYDPDKLSYEDLLDFFYRSHDPTTKDRQGGDIGTQYRSAILYHDDEQKRAAEAFTDKIRPRFGSAGVATTVDPVGKFWNAEEYHQEYLDKNPHGYECPTHFERTWEKIVQRYGGRL